MNTCGITKLDIITECMTVNNTKIPFTFLTSNFITKTVSNKALTIRE